MALIEELLVEVSEPALREALEQEVRALKKRTEFGLVFERHLPESVLLPPSVGLRAGAEVRLRAEPEGDRRLFVRKLGKRKAAVGERGAEETKSVAIKDLLVVRHFDEPLFPTVRASSSLRRGGEHDAHLVIQGENHDALQLLRYTHAGKVDLIYIDPPFNTEARDWKYNNNYVDPDDDYRHSKWLTMMERRLELAKRLLNPDESVLIVAIDENEVHRLGLLLQQLFRGSKIQMVTVLINPAGASIIDQFSRVDEHLLFVHIGSARPIRTLTDTTPGSSTFVTEEGEAKPFQWEPFQRRGGNSRREDTKAKFFPVHIDSETGTIVGCGDHLPEGLDRREAPPPPEGCISQWPIKRNGTEACWQTSAPTFRRYLEEGRIRVGPLRKKTGRYGLSFLTSGVMASIERGELVVDGRDEKGALIVKNAEGRIRSQIGKTMWTNRAYSATEHGSTLLGSFLPRRKFPFPKSLYAVEDALRYYVGHKKDALIVDYFAGSGTTLHAALRLNRQDGGRRRTILVTNNEVSAKEAKALRRDKHLPGDPEWEAVGIFEFITKPRIEAAVTGKTPGGDPIDGVYKFVDEFPMAEGFDENVEFVKLDYLDPDDAELGRSTADLLAVMWLRAGAHGQCPQADLGGPFVICREGGFAVLLDEAAFTDMTAEIAEDEAITHVFAATNYNDSFAAMASRLPGRRVEMIPRTYLDWFRRHKGESA